MAENDQVTASRGKFLGAAGITGAALAAGAWRTDKAGATRQAAKAGPVRSYVAGSFALVLDGADGGFVRSADGGTAVGEVASEPIGDTYFAKKHIGNVKYEDMTIEIGMAMSKAVYDWISSMLRGVSARKDGAVIAADFNYDAISTREFYEALITEVGFPALDASSKDTAFMTVKLAPETTRLKPSSGKLTAEKTQQKKWLPSNFRLDIKGMPTSKVNKIDALTIKQTVVTGEIGDVRDPVREPGKLEYPNLSFTLPESDAQPWLDWHEDFVIRGNNGEGQEKTGALTYLTPDLKTELGRIDFFNLGIFKVAPEKVESSSEQIRRVKVELYVERIEFAYLA